MSAASRARQTERNRRYERRTQKAPPIRFLGRYTMRKETRGGLVRAFGPGTIIKASDREYFVTQAGNFLRGSVLLGEFQRDVRTRNHKRRKV